MMPISTTTGLAAVLNVIRQQASASDAELEFFEYSPTAGYQSVGLLEETWFAFRDTVREGRFLFLVLADSVQVQTIFSGKPSHALIGDRYYRFEEVPEEPLASNDMLKYWLIRCEPTGQRQP